LKPWWRRGDGAGALFAEGPTLGRLDGSAKDVAGTAEGRLLGVDAGDLEPLFGVEVAVCGAEAPAALGDDADATPGAIGDFKDLGEKLLGGSVAVVGDDAAVGVFDFVAALLELEDGAADSIEQVEGLEAGDYERDLIFFGEGRVLPVAHHAADVAGEQKSPEPGCRRLKDGFDGGGNEDVGDEDGEVPEATAFGDMDAHGVGGSGGLESYAEEDYLFVGMLQGQIDGVERRIDDADVAARALIWKRSASVRGRGACRRKSRR